MTIAGSCEFEDVKEMAEYFLFREMLDAETEEGTIDGKYGCGTCCDRRVSVAAILVKLPLTNNLVSRAVLLLASDKTDTLQKPLNNSRATMVSCEAMTRSICVD